MFGQIPMEVATPVTLFTDSYVARGIVRTRQRRLSDILNEAQDQFLVLEEVTLDEFGSRAMVDRAPYAQINLDTVLFGVGDTPVEAMPELRTIKVPERALVIVPPFRIIGRIHLLPEQDLRYGLDQLTGRFIPVTEALYWSDTLGEPRVQARMLAVNHARAHIFAPYAERDVWEGLGGSAPAEAGAPVGAAGSGEGPAAAAHPDEAWPAADLERASPADPLAPDAASDQPASDRPASDQPASDQPAPDASPDPWRDLPR